jgi:hypothetical protein
MRENVIHRHFLRRALKLVIPSLVLLLLLGLAAKSGSVVVERVEVQQTSFAKMIQGLSAPDCGA